MSNKNSKSPTRIDAGKSIVPITNEVITFLTTAGVADVGSPAGDIVYANLAFSPVLSLVGDREAEFTGDPISSSLRFTTGVMDSTKEVGFVYDAEENLRFSKTAAKLTVDGQWALDAFSGLLIIRKKTNGTSQTITSYKARGNANTIVPTVLTAGSATTSTVASSATNVTLLAANAARKGASFFNESTQVLYLKLGAVASATDYTVQIAAGGYYELPPTIVYTSKIDGIWASANGNCRVTELA